MMLLHDLINPTVRANVRAFCSKFRAAKPFRYVSDPAFEYDVQKRIPSVDKARQVLGFEATTSLSQMLDEVIPWIKQAIEDGTI